MAKAEEEAKRLGESPVGVGAAGDVVGAQGGVALASALEKNQALTRLDLRSCWLAADGAKAIAEALKCNATVATLSLLADQLERVRPQPRVTVLNLLYLHPVGPLVHQLDEIHLAPDRHCWPVAVQNRAAGGSGSSCCIAKRVDP